ncbi:MAG: DUF799 family lipoprotein [bacterium]|nr:DUF799 family lipoprotein [bacterium]
MGKRIISSILLSFWVLAIIGACYPRVKTAPEFAPPKLVAILLLDNQSNDLQIAGLVRDVFFKKLADRGFNLAPLAVVDTLLLNLGITDGGQLGVVAPCELGDSLGADWLVYGTVVEASYITTGIYLKKSVKLNFNIVNALNGATIWEGKGEGTKSELHLDFKEAGKEFIEQLKEKVVRGILDHPLREEAEQAVDEALANLPWPSGYYTRRKGCL